MGQQSCRRIRYAPRPDAAEHQSVTWARRSGDFPGPHCGGRKNYHLAVTRMYPNASIAHRSW